MSTIPPGEPARRPVADDSPSGSVPAGSAPAGGSVPAASAPAGSAAAAGSAPAGSVPIEQTTTLREDVVAREKSEFGGFKFGSAFFGWLTATGTAVILTALVTATGAAVGLGVTDGTGDLDQQESATIGIVGAIALVVVVLVAYFCGGYVAGRMARFDGLKQGLAVWLWAVVIAVVVAIIGAIAGGQNLLARIDGFPRIPVNEGALTSAGIITAVIVAVASLAGALLGGVAGMRFHRKVDRAGLGR